MYQAIIFSDCGGTLGVGRYGGAYRIATELRNSGYSVKVIEYFSHYNLEILEKILKLYMSKSTIFVGFSSTFFSKPYNFEQISSALLNADMSLRTVFGYNALTDLFPQSREFIKELFDIIHEINNNCKIIVGGYKANSFYYPGVDYWVLGQGESSIVAIANHLCKNDPLKGIKTSNGIIVTDKLYPYNNFSLSKILFNDDDYLFPGENIPIETARGCVFRCSFCSFNLNGKKFGEYTKQVETFKDELIYNYEKFGITEYMVSDDTFNDSVQKVEYFFNIIKQLPFKIKLTCYSRLEIIGSNMEIAHMYKEMGVKLVQFGIETMNKDTGKYIGKLGDRDKIINILSDLKSIWKEDIYMSSGFIIGLPYESEESIKNTIEWLNDENNPLTTIQISQYFSNSPVILKIENVEYSEMINAGFVPNSDGWTYQNISKIIESPGKYGYTLGSRPGSQQWKNYHMSSQRAAEIEKDFYISEKCIMKKRFAVDFHGYNRIRNLGYSHEELKDMYYDDLTLLKEIIQKSNIIKNNYLSKLLS